jgi:hypothetical protein
LQQKEAHFSKKKHISAKTSSFQAKTSLIEAKTSTFQQKQAHFKQKVPIASSSKMQNIYFHPFCTFYLLKILTKIFLM